MTTIRPSPLGTVVTGASIWAAVTQEGMVRIIALIVAVPFTIWVTACIIQFLVSKRSTVLRAIKQLRNRSS